MKLYKMEYKDGIPIKAYFGKFINYNIDYEIIPKITEKKEVYFDMKKNKWIATNKEVNKINKWIEGV